jgi:hypothetical protein
MLKPISIISVVTGAAILATAAIATNQAQAAIVTYDFTVNVAKGSLAGQSFNGTFSYDDATLKGTGVETLGINQGLTVCMNYFGRNYTEVNDTSYPALPKLILEDGVIQQLDFWVQPNQRVNWWNLPGWNVNLSKRPAKTVASACQRQ